MLSTKDLSVGSGSIKPVAGPGNQKIKINSITFDQTPYDSDAYNIMLHVETEPVEGEFQGFLKDMNNPNGERYEGQVGRVRFSPYPYKDATLPSGREINRDTEVLKGMVYLSEVLNKREELDKIQEKLTLKKHISNYSILKYGHDSWQYYDNLSPEIKLNPSRYGYLEDNILFFYEGKDWTELTDEHNVCPHCNSFLI